MVYFRFNFDFRKIYFSIASDKTEHQIVFLPTIISLLLAFLKNSIIGLEPVIMSILSVYCFL